MKLKQIKPISLQMAKTSYFKIAVTLWLGLAVTTGCKKSNIATENLSAASGAASPSLKINSRSSSNLWYDEFVAFDNNRGGDYYNSTDNDVLALDESQVLGSYVNLYEVTHNTSWLTKLTTHFDVTMSNAILDTDGYKQWEDHLPGDPQPNRKWPTMLTDGELCYPIARFIRLVYADPALSSFTTKANTYKAFIEDEVIPKWTDANSRVGNCWNSAGYFKRPAATAGFPASDGNVYGTVNSPLPYNQMNIYGAMLVVMWDIDRAKTDYKTKFRGLGSYFKQAISTNGTGYTWQFWNIPNNHVEDGAHGNLEIEFATEMYNTSGYEFTATDMQNFTNTLVNNMWNQSISSPLLTDKVDGTGGNNTNDTYYQYGWIRLAQFDNNPWYIAANYLDALGSSIHPGIAKTLTLITAWDPLKLKNQGFEYTALTDATKPSFWTRISTASTASVDTINELTGKACARVYNVSTNTSYVGFYQDWKEWAGGTNYTLTFNVKTSVSAGARVLVKDMTTNTILVSATYGNASWASNTLTFNTPSVTSDNVRVYLENGTVGLTSTSYFDNVKIKKTGDAF